MLRCSASMHQHLAKSRIGARPDWVAQACINTWQSLESEPDRIESTFSAEPSWLNHQPYDRTIVTLPIPNTYNNCFMFFTNLLIYRWDNCMVRIPHRTGLMNIVWLYYFWTSQSRAGLLFRSVLGGVILPRRRNFIPTYQLRPTLKLSKLGCWNLKFETSRLIVLTHSWFC